MTVRARGTKFQLTGAVETTPGTPASSGFQLLPCYDFDLSASGPLKEDPLLSYGAGRNLYDNYVNDITYKGTAKVPVESGSFDFWMNALMGNTGTVTNSGTTTLTSTSGATALKSFTMEKGLLDVPDYYLFSGVYVDSYQIQTAAKDVLTATVGLMGMSDARSTSSSSGTITTNTADRFYQRNAAITQAGTTTLTAVTSADLTMSNNIEEIRAVRSDSVGLPYAMDPGQVTVKGKLTLRYESGTLYDFAVARGSTTLSLKFLKSSNNYIEFYLPNVKFSQPSIPIKGPNGIEQTLDFAGGWDSGSSSLLTVRRVHYP